MITKDPANKATGEVFEDFTPVAFLIVKQEDLSEWIKNNPGLEFMIEEIKPLRPDFSHNEDWVALKSKANKAWSDLKNHELELIHPTIKTDGTTNR